MAVPRIEWQCPRCERLYAIRADIETPEFCPQCRAEPAGAANPPESSAVSVPYDSGIRDARQGVADEHSTDFSSEEQVRPPLPVSQLHTSPSGTVRKYPALKLLSLVYKVFAALIAVVGLVVLVIAFVAAVTAEDTSDQYTGILIQLGAFVASMFVAATLYAFGELIQLLVDIEWNTRRH